MRRDDATEAQVRAADPAQSTWLSANAGSGKTRVLIDRVARLLMAGTEPQRILCLTYTKAAASEMQNRLFVRLGEWAMLPEPELRAALGKLGVEGAVNAAALAQARRLFARAIETPGGLKIQTIHSFCAALLKRFPLEAGVSPDFTELDDRAAKLLREEIVEELAAGANIAAMDAIAGLVSGDDLTELLADLSRNRDAFSKHPDFADLLSIFSLPPDYSPESATQIAFIGSENSLFERVIPVLEKQSKTMVDLANLLRSIDLSDPTSASLEPLFEAFLYKKDGKPIASAKTGSIPTKNAQAALGDILVAFHQFMERVAKAKESIFAYKAAKEAFALHQFAGAFLPLYAKRKAEAGWLDFDDLIARAAALLSNRAMAAWVLYRLDGGIDHILVDEAQDTSPGQWQVIERLAEEFTAGEGARGETRTIFVVGDKKQSIYSFQGADLAAFDVMKRHFSEKHAAVAVPFQERELLHSFRSSDAILKLVDLTFDERVNRGLGGTFKHLAFHNGLPGRADLWPPVPKTEKPEEKEWFDPTDILPDDHETVILARSIASEIRRLIDCGTHIPDGKASRAVHEGDFLILVQRRSALFFEIIRACKAAGLEIAGADRLKIGGELAVKDLGALLKFLATPEDDLSLAATLRSPLFGWTEGQLYELAHRRGPDEFLWTALRDRADEFADTMEILNDLRDQADFLRPYDLIERMLTRHNGRRKLLARLGPEAEDGIDALLSQALAFEQADVPSLTGFLVWLETDDVEVKRRLDSTSKAIRVMTVHGAKGLESPIVILPDTAKPREDVRTGILCLDGKPVWKTRAAESPSAIAAERTALLERQREERMRLLYVAMTRAEVWLIVCGAGDVGKGAESWYGLIAEAMQKVGAVTAGPILRYALGSWPDEQKDAAPETSARPVLPDWISVRAPAVAPVGTLSPSELGGAKALPGESGLNEDAAKRRGTFLHLLLEHLPTWPQSDWPRIAEALLSTGEEAAVSGEIETLLLEARQVLMTPEMAELLGPDSFAEVELTTAVPRLGGRILHGTIDRLVISSDRVLAVDYKSNAVVPGTQEEVPDGILRQMGAYAAMLAEIYPERRIDTAILWTRTGRLMPLDPDIVRQALASTTIP